MSTPIVDLLDIGINGLLFERGLLDVDASHFSDTPLRGWTKLIAKGDKLLIAKNVKGRVDVRWEPHDFSL